MHSCFDVTLCHTWVVCRCSNFSPLTLMTYMRGLAATMATPTLCYVHIVLGSCLATAVRTRKIARNPMFELAKIPPNKSGQHGAVLEAEQLRSLVQGFRSSTLFPVVAVAAFTGARRNEILALRWNDLDVAAKTLRIERAIEDTNAHGLRMKGPKTARGKRTQ